MSFWGLGLLVVGETDLAARQSFFDHLEIVREGEKPDLLPELLDLGAVLQRQHHREQPDRVAVGIGGDQFAIAAI